MRIPSSLRTALVIQGPILSTGRTGNSLHNPESGIGKDKIVEYDSSEVVNFYLYDKFNPDGSLNELYDDEEKIVPSETAEDIWNILIKLKSNNEK